MKAIPKRTSRRGVTLTELLASTLILSFLVAATATLFTVGHRQQNRARYYSQVQTDLRSGLRVATRSIRHAYTAVSSSTTANFPAGSRDSNGSQIIVRVPEPAGSANADMEIRFYVSGNALYAQRGDAAAPGQKLITGVQSLTINYFRTTDGTRASADGSPTTATEAQLTLSTNFGSVTSRATAYVAFRNAISSL